MKNHQHNEYPYSSGKKVWRTVPPWSEPCIYLLREGLLKGLQLNRQKGNLVGQSSKSSAEFQGYVDSFLDSRLLYIIMEYADNGDLATQIKLKRDTQGLLTGINRLCFALGNLTWPLYLTHVDNNM